LDTDVASLLHRGTLAGPLAARLIGREPLITFVTFGELAKWAEIRNWGQRRRDVLTSWLSRIAVLPGDEAVAATWGQLSIEECGVLSGPDLDELAESLLSDEVVAVFLLAWISGQWLDLGTADGTTRAGRPYRPADRRRARP
jgi:hypothetical protein